MISAAHVKNNLTNFHWSFHHVYTFRLYTFSFSTQIYSSSCTQCYFFNIPFCSTERWPNAPPANNKMRPLTRIYCLAFTSHLPPHRLTVSFFNLPSPDAVRRLVSTEDFFSFTTWFAQLWLVFGQVWVIVLVDTIAGMNFLLFVLKYVNKFTSFAISTVRV